MNSFYRIKLPNLLLLLSLFCTSMLLVIGIYIPSHFKSMYSQQMRQALSGVSIGMLLKAIEMEVPYFRALPTDNTPTESKPITLFFFETVTGLQPTDLRSLLGRELPGLSGFNSEVIALGKNVNLQHYIIESSPPTTIPSPSPGKPAEETNAEEKKKLSTPTEPGSVFIYSTHSTESWTLVSEDGHDDEKNILLVSQKLAEELKKKGIKTRFDNTNHQEKLKQKGLSYPLSYAESLKTVQEAMKQEKQIDYLFDIHRDTPNKKETTVVINGKSYARPFFVLGKQNPKWEQNAKLANEFHRLLEKKYPGLSIGVFAKGGGNGEYNQSISPNSLLIEIGGVENTLEESYNTAAALADVFAEIYFARDEKVHAPESEQQEPM